MYVTADHATPPFHLYRLRRFSGSSQKGPCRAVGPVAQVFFTVSIKLRAFLSPPADWILHYARPESSHWTVHATGRLKCCRTSASVSHGEQGLMHRNRTRKTMRPQWSVSRRLSAVTYRRNTWASRSKNLAYNISIWVGSPHSTDTLGFKSLRIPVWCRS